MSKKKVTRQRDTGKITKKKTGRFQKDYKRDPSMFAPTPPANRPNKPKEPGSGDSSKNSDS